MTSVVPILSGGLDSTTLVYYLRHLDYDIKSVVLFNYGQRHKKELDFAAKTADRLGIPYHLTDLYRAGLTQSIRYSGSSLVTDEEVPEGHYAQENMKSTVVPNRNMIMIAIAGAIAVAQDADVVAFGAHAGDHFIYPDCRPEFVERMDGALYEGNKGFGSHGYGVGLIAPFLHMTKTEIALLALQLEVPLEKTWSCYKGGDKHCGRCGTCVERLEAITEARRFLSNSGKEVEDPTEYEDTQFWRTATQ